MPMDPVLRAMLTQEITQAPYVGHDAYGKPSYGAAFTRPAYLEVRVETLLNQQGQERVSNTAMILDGDLPISVRDLVTLPDGSKPALQIVAPKIDPDQPGVIEHWECRL